ncbi:MAG TPA: glycosyltransferase family 2 protein [Chthoniobacterales bacterium]|jgi:hypothetical protein|nr:glycosyltransferase family 2 protein [Chthoniobacterales bacterium]
MRWAIITGMYNVADVAEPFCRYHLEQGADQIIVAEYGSTDGTQDLLRPFARRGEAIVVPIPTHRFVEYDPSNVLLAKIREDKSADWVSFLDPDEFLTGPCELKEALAEGRAEGHAILKTQRRNMSGAVPPEARDHFLEKLNLKIIQPEVRVPSAASPLSSPWIFSQVSPKVSLAADCAGLTTIPGDHDVRAPNDATISTAPDFEILHYPIRSYASFREKVELTARYFAENPEFGPGIGWHWRRWIKLLEAGELLGEYNAQFPSKSSAAHLLKDGRVVEEERLATWSRRRET